MTFLNKVLSLNGSSRSALIYQYSLPIQTQRILKDDQIFHREGLVIELRQGEQIGRGEIAPLPSFSHETRLQAQQQIESLLNAWVHEASFVHLMSMDWCKFYPSVAFGFSMALAELLQVLPPAKPIEIAPLLDLFSINDHFHQDDLKAYDLAQDALNDRQLNPKIVKSKVGRFSPVQEARALNTWIRRYPDLLWRLDANQAWSYAQANQFFTSLESYAHDQIVFVEEPCASVDLSLKIADKFKVGIAWDESLRQPQLTQIYHQQKVMSESVKALILKPSLMGDLIQLKSWIDYAHQCGIEAVISSSLESNFALNQLAKIAAHWTPNTPVGLDTGKLFSANLIEVFDENDRSIISLADHK